MQESQRYNCKKILFIGENYRASQFKSNYSISFDPHSETNYRLPLWQFYLILRPELQEILFGPRIQHKEFDREISFVVSNPANFIRNSFYDNLKSDPQIQIFSYGRFKTNNLELQRVSQGKYWRDAKYEFFSNIKHKFNICFEHSSYPYYCTEKLMDSFLTGSLPIYWGDPKINEDWNKDAFINVMKMSLDDVHKLIINSKTNEELFNKIYNEPIFTDEQRERHQKNINEFENWLINVIKT